MTVTGVLVGFVFLATCGLLLAAFRLAGARRTRLDVRLGELSGKVPAPVGPRPVAGLARRALPRVGKPLLPEDERQRTRLQARLLRAGYYSPQALVIYLGVKMVLIFTPWLVGLAVGLAGLLPVHWGVALGAVVGLVGMVGPGLWLSQRKATRLARLRASLPDVLDVLVICLEAGTSLAEAFRRVVSDLGMAHPLLGVELKIVLREVQLGRPLGEALRLFAERTDLEEARSLAGILGQAERLGGGLVQALRVHAESLRHRRAQRAEETAQKASTKVLFPTLLFIFPGIFIIILGPAAFKVIDLVDRMKVEKKPPALEGMWKGKARAKPGPARR